MEEGSSTKRSEPRKARLSGVLGLLPPEWQNAYRSDIMPALKALAYFPKLQKSSLEIELQLSSLQQDQAELLAKIEECKMKHAGATGDKAQHSGKQSSVQTALERQAQVGKIQAKISKLQEKARAVKEEIDEAEGQVFRAVGFQGYAGPGSNPGASSPERSSKRTRPSSSLFVDLLLCNPDLLSVLLPYLPGDSRGATALACCSRGAQWQVMARLTHLRDLRQDAPLALLCAHLPRLVSIDLTGCPEPNVANQQLQALVDCGMHSRLQELRVDRWPVTLCNVQWPRLHTLYTGHFELDNDALRQHEPLPALSTLYITYHTMENVTRALEAGLLPQLTRVVCTPQRGFCGRATSPGAITGPRNMATYGTFATGNATLARLLQLTPRSDALQLYLGEGPTDHFVNHLLRTMQPFRNLRYLALQCIRYTALLPPLVSGTPLLERLYLSGCEYEGITRRSTSDEMDLPGSMGRWPVLHTLGFAVSRASEAMAMAVLQAAGPGLKVLDLSGDLGKPTELEAAQRVYDILTALKALEAAEDVAWRASLTTLLLPPCGSPRISHTAQVFCSILASVLSRLPNLHTLAAPTVDNATTVAFITARAGGGLRRLHTLRFKDSFKDSAQLLLLLSLMRQEERAGGSEAFTVYAEPSVMDRFCGTLEKLISQSGLKDRLPKLNFMVLSASMINGTPFVDYW